MPASLAMTRVLHTNPVSDREFRHDAEAALIGGPLTAPQLEARMRDRYPNVVVRCRGLVGEPDGFYLYRDGRWTSDRAGGR